MDKEVFKRKMDGLGIPRHWYFIDDYGIDDESIRVKEENGKWQVYYSERGGKFELKQYDREADAYQDLTNRLIEEQEDRRIIEERKRQR